MSWDQPAWLVLALLALLPLLRPPRARLAHAWLGLMPIDRPSLWLDRALRVLAAAVIALLALAVAGPYRPEFPIERVGTGAEIVLVLDRSRSMDQAFVATSRPPPGALNSPEALQYYSQLRPQGSHTSKGKVARQLLADFAAQRPDDRFGLVVFSSLPMRVLDFTQKPDLIQAGIAAGNVGRGLSETDIGLAMLAALDFFKDRAYTGSRVVMLVSDGGDQLDPDVRERIAYLVQRYRVAVYWMYIRTARSPGLGGDAEAPQAPAGTAADPTGVTPIGSATGTNIRTNTSTITSPDITTPVDPVPERSLHRFFRSLGTPYQAYEAENPESLEKAIADVSRLQNLPIAYTDIVPRRDLATPLCLAALAGVLLLLGVRWATLQRWT